jgi:NAD-dependent SIR2 family protein deacetylase
MQTMDNKEILALQKEFPRATCLRCTNLVYTAAGVSGCIKELDPRTCGRNFNPNGGNKVLV